MQKQSFDVLQWVSEFSQQLALFEDINTILDRILLEARRLSHADAGTVFLVEGEDLAFAYTHNDTLFHVDKAHKYSYANAKLPINTESIAGYCATYGTSLHIANVRKLHSNMPFAFNDSFDKATGYTTVSLLCLPLIGKGGSTLGVIQLINSLEDGKIVPFDEGLTMLMQVLSVQAVNAIERSLMAREMMYRMQLMAALSDPKETAPHVERVGAIAAEIYQVVAEKNTVDIDTLRALRSQIRLAAMLHDLGKVAIPHEILKKPGKLTPEEFAIMQTHCSEGSKLFSHASELTDCMAKEITLHHHQKWNGTGYTGDPDTAILSGKDIPLAARITAVADVFDALTSARCYKPAWTWEDAMVVIKKDSGSHFDPEIVEAFLSVEDIAKAIYRRYQG